MTSKAWKHKDGRVKEAIDLDTFVEDSMKEIQGVFVAEKAVSKQQQKFMGMVHSMQSGNKVKGASPELKKVAKDMGKKDAKDFAGTKHKGLPKKVSESVQLTESTIDAICHRYGRECKDFMTTGDMADDLYHALYDYYFDDMPYGVKKARDGDPYEWVADRFYDDMGGQSWQADNAPSAIPPNVKVETDNSLAELARLAGYDMPLQEEPNEGNEFSGARADAIRAGKDSFSVDGKVYKVSGEEISESTCNMTAEGEMCPKHGFAECAMYESKDNKKPDADGDGVPDWADKKSGKDDNEDDKEKVDECGMPSGMDPMSQDSGFNVSTNVDTKTGRKSVTVTADGDAADQLAQMLKMAGMQASGHSHTHAVEVVPTEAQVEVEEEYINEPDEKYATVDTIISQGDDLHRQKKQYADKPKAGDNPMATETALRLEGKLAAMYASLKMKSQ